MREIQTEQTKGIYEFGAFRLNAAEGVLFAAGEPVKLTPKAVQTLVLLVAARGHVVSKNEFFAKVWGAAFVEDAALTFNISQLRKSLAAFDADTKFIETVPKRGFRFLPEVREISLASSAGETITERRLIEEITIEETFEIDDALENSRRLRAPNNRLARGGGENSMARRTNFFYALTGIGAAAAIILTAAIFYFSRPPAAKNSIESIAVLPFRPIAAGEADKILSVGLADALITSLGKSQKITVRPVSSITKYAGAEFDSLLVGRELKTDAVLEGSFQRGDRRLRVNARLLRVRDGKQIWAGTLNEIENDIFKLQDVVSAQVAASLDGQLSDGGRIETTAARPTESREAYEFYLRGRYHWSQRTPESFARSLELFEQAIALDPNFADAHAGVGDSYLGFYDYNLKPAAESVQPAKAAIQKALQLDPNLSNAHSSLGLLQVMHDWNWAAAEKSLNRAIELTPNNALARARRAWFLNVAGKHDEALREFEIVERLDPTAPVYQANIGFVHLSARRLDAAEERLLRVVRLNPDYALPRWYLGGVFYLQNKRSAAFAEYFKALELEGDTALAGRLTETYQTENEAAALEIWRADYEKQFQTKHFSAYNVAFVAALQGDRRAAVEWLETAKRQRDPFLVQALRDAEFDFVRDAVNLSPEKID